MTEATASRLKRWFWGLNLLIPTVLAIVSIVDLVDFLLDPEAYPIGWEGGGWRYRTYENYVFSSVAFIVGAGLVVFGAIRAQNAVVRWSARVTCLLVSILILLPMLVWLLYWLDLVPLHVAAAVQEAGWNDVYVWLLRAWGR
jgi:hypothetical protein